MIIDTEFNEDKLVHLFNNWKIATNLSESIWILAYTLILVLGVTTGVSVIAWLE